MVPDFFKVFSPPAPDSPNMAQALYFKGVERQKNVFVVKKTSGSFEPIGLKIDKLNSANLSLK